MNTMKIQLTFLDLRGTAPCRMTQPPAEAVVCLGNFDGVHRAHKVLVRETVAMAREISDQEGTHVSPGAFFFIRPTLDYKKNPTGFTPVQVRGHLTTLRDKLLLFAQMGLEFACVCNFPDIRDLSPEDFISLLRNDCNCVGVTCGFNYFFGKGAAGNISHLREQFGWNRVFVQPEMTLDGMTVSSSRIRACLEQGDTETAEQLLGRPYSLDTNVVHGKRLGRTLGFPTANQYFPAERAIPSRGVYAVLCHTPYGTFPGVSNVGIRPTTDSHGRVNCETHIIGMKGDLYGRRIRVEFLSKLRNEQKFNGVEELVEAIRKDAADADAVARARGLI
jgi:riboflavin kinase/FMN adenylyltransferase